jgi:cell division protein FtsI (penicillin-binding protein 3)
MANIKKDILWRIILCYSIVVIFALAILVKMFTIQVVEGKHWLALSDSLTVRYKSIPAVRGNIYAANGELLATSIPIYELHWDASVVDPDTFTRYSYELAFGLHQVFPQNDVAHYLSMLRRAKNENNKYLLLKRKATYLDVKKVKELPVFNKGQYRGGLIVLEETRRKKPLGPLASRTIGFSRNEQIGVGLERTFNEVLGGVSGKRLVEKISGGYRPVNDANEIEPIDGRDIYTSISAEFQDIVSTALFSGLVRTKADHGCAVLMDVKTGRIVAIANLKKTENGYAERYNYAVGELYEPGSTFKLFSTLAVLEEGTFSPSDSIRVEYGKKRYNKQWMYDSERGKYNKLTLEQCFERSSNVGISTAVVESFRRRESRFFEYLESYGLFQPTQVEIVGEPDPYFNKPGRSTWSPITLPWLSLGYECRITPLQLLSAYNAIANDGIYVYPSLVTGLGSTGKMTEKFQPRYLSGSPIASEESIAQIQSMLEGVVSDGTAQSLKSLPFSVAGKTGTAQIASGSDGYQSNKQYNASFAGYFPADEPRFSCIIVVNKPQGNYYGSAVAVPIFKEIASKVFVLSDAKPLPESTIVKFPRRVKGYQPDLCVIASELGIANWESEASWSVVKASQGVPTLRPMDLPEYIMPDLSGMGIRDALFLLENKGYKVRYHGVGKVVEQSPPKGTRIKKGRTIYLRLGL